MTATALDQRDPRVRRSAIGLLVVIAAGALALSFNGLALLGSLAGFGALAPVFAVVVDAGTAAATLYWLTGRPRSRSTRYARRFALALLAVSLAGNATAHALAAAGAAITGPAVALVLALPWWAAGTVGASWTCPSTAPAGCSNRWPPATAPGRVRAGDDVPPDARRAARHRRCWHDRAARRPPSGTATPRL